jgi:restriction system protein
MAIPDFQTFMKPYLIVLKDGKEKHFREMVEELAQYFRIDELERKELLQSGQSRFENRVGWAKTYLYHAGLVESPRRGYNKISKKGLAILEKDPPKVTTKLLQEFPEFRAFQGKRNVKKEKKVDKTDNIRITPEETLDRAYGEVRQKLISDVLDQVSKLSPKQFENLVVELLVKMGYGGSMLDAGQAIGKSGDEGIDGISKRINWD